MRKLNQSRFPALFLILAYVMSACSGAPAGNGGQPSGGNQAQEVVFTGTVEAINGTEWTVSGQSVSLTGTTSLDANIQVGDNVKVEARVDANGVVSALSIELAGAADDNANPNDSGGNVNSNDGNSNDDNANDANANEDQADNSNSGNSNANGNTNGNDNADDQEVSGTVEAITVDSITINGVMYQIADFTEFKDLIAVGDVVKAHFIVNSDGMLTIREIEKSSTIGNNDNSNSNGSDDNANSNEDNINNNSGNDNGDDDGSNSGNHNGNDNGDDDHNDNDSGSNSNG